MRRTHVVLGVLDALVEASDPDGAEAQRQRLSGLGFVELAGDERTGVELAELTGYGDSTVYGVLGRLHRAGCVDRRNEQQSDPTFRGRKPRVFYRINDAGRAFLNRK